MATVRQFDSVAAFVETVRAQEPQSRWIEKTDGHGGDSWDGGIRGARTFEVALTGLPNLTEQVRNVLDAKAPIGMSSSNYYAPSVAGSRVSVPDYLTGTPTCMRRRAKREASRPACRVYVCNAASATVHVDTMLRRGAYILAFVERLQATGADIELFIVDEAGTNKHPDFFTSIRVETRPLNLSESAFAIVHPAFNRHLVFAYADIAGEGYTGAWPASRRYGMGEATTQYNDNLIRLLGGDPSRDIMIPAAHSRDPLLANPEQWLKDRVQQFKGDDT